MNDEIKEILDNFKIYEDRYKKCNETQFIIFYKDIHLLTDYITNLQQENERLKDNAIHNDKVVDKARWNEMIYKSRCEKASECINNFWKEKSYYESIENCLEFATMNEFEKEDLLNILQNGSDSQ